MIKFSIGGKSLDPRNIKDALMSAMLESIRAQIKEKVGSVRDPETGQFPTVIVRGEDLEHLTIHVEGSAGVVALVKERLGILDQEPEPFKGDIPLSVFLSYAFEDRAFAKRIAEALVHSGIPTWWSQWSIGPGDSLRQKIDEGIADCTHFLVLLTPTSIRKPWVNQEMDAGLVRMLSARCKFLPVRYGLSASALPPTLSGMLSPEISTDDDISQLVNDIHGVSRRPPLGAPPPAVAGAKTANTGYSPAATAIARLFVERSRSARFGDPQINVDEIAASAGLSREDTEDALFELSAFFKRSGDHILANGILFAQFDQYWMPWDPAADAIRLAADIINDPKFPSSPEEIAKRYGWNARQLNPVLYFLLERKLILDYRALGSRYATIKVVGNDNMRRFLKGRA